MKNNTTKQTTKENTIVIIDRLKEKKKTITFAESCTGGRIAAEFTAISGASSVLMGSAVTYANEIKSAWLEVKEETLINHGAVSSQCVEEMLSGILKMASADYAMAVSGIAGPTGGTDDKPVGTVYIGVSNGVKSIVERHLFKGNRESVQEQATATVISLFKKIL